MDANKNNTQTKSHEEIIADLKAQIEAAKKEADKTCGGLNKYVKFGIGTVLLAGAAGVGYYFGSQESSDTTTVIAG